MDCRLGSRVSKMQVSRMLTALDGDPEGRNSASESPVLDQFSDNGGDTAEHAEQTTTTTTTTTATPTTTPSRTVRFLLPVSVTHSSSIVTGSVVAPDQPIIIGETTSGTPTRRPFVPGHRRRSTHVTRLDLERFRKDVLGIDTPGFGFDDEASLPAVDPSIDPQLESLNRDFEAVARSMNTGTTSDSGSFSSGVDNAGNQSNMTNVPRQSMSPAMSHTPSQVNGAGIAGMNAGIPLNAGHQMDLHHLYDMVLELSEVLKNNRQMTQSIVSSAEEVMVCLAPTIVSLSFTWHSANDRLATLCFGRHLSKPATSQWRDLR